MSVDPVVVGADGSLAVLVKRFPRLSETFILNEFLELGRQGLPVRLFAIMDPHEARSQPEALALMSQVTFLDDGAKWGRLGRAARAARRHPGGALKAAAWVLTQRSRASLRHYLHALTLVSHLDDGNFAHLHAHFAHTPAAIAFIAKKISGISYSVTGHAKDIYTARPASLARRARAATFVSTCTEANRRFLIEETGLSPSQVVLCRHGVDLARFTGIVREPVPGRILSIGRLVPKKGFDILIEACAILAQRGIEFELRIIGSGDLGPQLSARAQELGIGDRVELGKGRPQSELLGELAQAELFALAPYVLPDGDRDGVPNVILEAMAAGVAVVSTAVSGIPEVVETGRTGTLVAPGEPGALADALAMMLCDAPERERIAAAARTFVIANFGLAESVKPLMDRFAGLAR